MSIIGSVTNFVTGGNQSKAAGASQASVDALRSLELPDVSKMQIQLDQLVQQGQITPEEAQTYLMEQSEMNNISLDPALRQAQMDALRGLSDIATSGGLTAMDKAKLSQIQNQENAAARGQREAIIQSMQARGLGGSGIELMSQLQNQQDSATRASQRGMDVAAMAQQRALDALMQSGQLGGQIQQQDFDRQSQIAKANDAISQFNTQNKQNVANTNVANRNAAQAANLQEKQRIADQNVNLKNQQQQYNKQLAQQDFENRYKKAGGTAGAYQNQAGQFNAMGQQNAQMFGSILGAGATMAASDERVKEEVEEFNPSDFLDNITSYKYKYKSPDKHGEGDQVGIMAQDLEKVAPQAISEDSDGTKMIDYSKMGGPMMAALADLSKRVKKVEGK